VDDPVFMYALLMMAGVLLNFALCGAVSYVVIKVFGTSPTAGLPSAGSSPRTAQILRMSTPVLQTSEQWKTINVVGVPEV
jgi:hypothetical protein